MSASSCRECAVAVRPAITPHLAGNSTDFPLHYAGDCRDTGSLREASADFLTLAVRETPICFCVLHANGLYPFVALDV